MVKSVLGEGPSRMGLPEGELVEDWLMAMGSGPRHRGQLESPELTFVENQEQQNNIVLAKVVLQQFLQTARLKSASNQSFSEMKT